MQVFQNFFLFIFLLLNEMQTWDQELLQAAKSAQWAAGLMAWGQEWEVQAHGHPSMHQLIPCSGYSLGNQRNPKQMLFPQGKGESENESC